MMNRWDHFSLTISEALRVIKASSRPRRLLSSSQSVMARSASRGKPSPFMSGEPFHHCTHTALSPECGHLYISDGYSNARIHKYTVDGKLLKSWGEPGTDPGQFNIPHNICCDPEGWIYVADRENHRVQVFDANGKWETQWNYLHRPNGMCLGRGITCSATSARAGRRARATATGRI